MLNRPVIDNVQEKDLLPMALAYMKFTGHGLTALDHDEFNRAMTSTMIFDADIAEELRGVALEMKDHPARFESRFGHGLPGWCDSERQFVREYRRRIGARISRALREQMLRRGIPFNERDYPLVERCESGEHLDIAPPAWDMVAGNA